MKKGFLTILLIVIVQLGYSQNYKLGKVSKDELQEKAYSLDASADAAYLYKKRRTYFEYVQNEGFKIMTKVHERIKIYNKDGYDWATKEIEFYTPNGKNPEEVSIKGAKTFVLNNGKIETHKLSKKGIFTEVKNKYRSKKKFTMPNLSEGCIVEWEYTISSPYNDIDKVVLQSRIPIKKIEYSVEIPEYYTYKTEQTGYLPINIQNDFKNSSIEISSKSRENSGGYSATKTNYSTDKIEYKTIITRVEKSNVPALIEEPYVNNIDNYKSTIIYELSSIKWTNQPIKFFSKSWQDVAKTVVNASNFGGQLKKTSHLKDDISILNNDLKTTSSKIIGALEYVKSKIKWNRYNGISSADGIRKAYKEGSGNIADINLTLVVVLRELGLNASPVLVSTRSHGFPVFPTISGFNYVIAVVETPKGNILLDASEKYSLPNVLPLHAINWRGIIIRKDKTTGFVDLSTSVISMTESSLNYKIFEDGLIEGMNRNLHKNYAALEYRNSKVNLKEETLISNIEVENNDIEILNFRLSNKHDLSKPIVELYKFQKEGGVEIIGNKMYITPMLFETTSENPFKIEVREYPIDFGTPSEEIINVTIQIPEGYNVESLPENAAKGMTENMGKFIYEVKNQGNKIQITSLVEINRGIVPANYYQEIKEMFKQIVAKQTEKIVLVKK